MLGILSLEKVYRLHSVMWLEQDHRLIFIEKLSLLRRLLPCTVVFFKLFIRTLKFFRSASVLLFIRIALFCLLGFAEEFIHLIINLVIQSSGS